MQFINKKSGEIHTALTKDEIKTYEASQAWEAVKETVKTPKEEVTEKPKATKEKKESLLTKLFK
jgi:hypothetical protein